jgi:hypothetical protein
MHSFSHGTCATCGNYDYVGPLHGERGGPCCCLICIGKWNAEHMPRLRAQRQVIKALKVYAHAGGSLYGEKFDQLKRAASIFGRGTGSDDFKDLTTELLTAAIALTHPDRHPIERRAEALRVTQELTALKPFVFPAPEPEPPPKPRDVCSKRSMEILNKPSPPPYPCDDCRETTSSFYCDVCKAQWEKERQTERERAEQKRKAKNARQRERYLRHKQCKRYYDPPTNCASCGNAFKPKRSDMQYCSAACRQRAYLKRDGKASNSKPLDREEIERAIRLVFTSGPDGAYRTDDLCARVFPGLRQPKRKHRAAVIPAAKRVCEQLGENWNWWRAELRGGTLMFWNRISVTSYAMARLKSEPWNCGTDDRLKASISPGGRYHEYVVEGGAWWKHCQDDIAKFKQTTANQNNADDDLTNRQQAPCRSHAEAMS